MSLHLAESKPHVVSTVYPDPRRGRSRDPGDAAAVPRYDQRFTPLHIIEEPGKMCLGFRGLKPEVDRRQEEIDKALAGIRELRKRTGRVTLRVLLSARDEGRRY